MAVATEHFSILRNWKYFPYTHLLSNNECAAELFLTQFRVAESSNFKPDGKLYLYSEREKLAGVRFLSGESNILKMKCGRLEPFVVTNHFDLREADIESSARFISDVLENAKELDHFSTPVSAADTNSQLALNAVGFRLADTILGYHLNHDLVQTNDFPEHVRAARDEDVKAISGIAAKCFSDRKLNVNRFISEPKFSPEDVGTLYASWTQAAVISGQSDLTLVYDDGSGPVGFMTFKLPSSAEQNAGLNLGKAVLSAVSPDAHKRGIYKKLLLGGCSWMKKNGVSQIEGKTQLSTIPVLRVWQNLGATLQIAYHTYHYHRN